MDEEMKKKEWKKEDIQKCNRLGLSPPMDDSHPAWISV